MIDRETERMSETETEIDRKREPDGQREIARQTDTEGDRERER